MIETHDNYMDIDPMYNMSQISVQTGWNEAQIMSAQALMMGMFPNKQNNYTVTDNRAQPPMKGFDFSQWYDQMDKEALPNQTTVFPIQMNGPQYDFVLSINDENCPYRQMVR